MTYDYREAFWDVWREPTGGPLESVFAGGATVGEDTVARPRDAGSTWHLAEMALFADRETRLCALRALGAFDDLIAQEALAAIAIEDPDDHLTAEAARASSRIYDRLTGA
ncbi:MAG: hypothetical protein JW767_11660 [Thermoleophilia bacterium]|nr:hypothetical protein [Thermoleophilia bacterium]